jgi:hypothetical protein
MAGRRAGHIRTQQRAFLESYTELGIVRYACQAAGVGRSTFYEWQERDPEFRIAVARAEQDANERIEREALRRAVEGDTQDVPLMYQGTRVGTRKVTTYSDTLLLHILKSRLPERYREVNRQELAATLTTQTADDQKARNVPPDDVDRIVQVLLGSGQVSPGRPAGGDE